MPHRRSAINNVLIRFVAAAVLALSWVIAWEMVLYAGELPGEGFAASILALLALMLHMIVRGQADAARHLPPAWYASALVAGVGLLIALVLLPLAWGSPMLAVFKLQLGGHTLSSTTLFDVALFLVVTGAMMTAFSSIKEPRG